MHDRARAADVLADLSRRCSEEASLAPLGTLIATPQVNKLLSGIFGASPYLTELIARNPAGLHDALAAVPEEHFAALVGRMTRCAAAEAIPEAMRALRLFKSDIALLHRVVRPRRRVAGDDRRPAGCRRPPTLPSARPCASFPQARAKGDWLAPDPAGYIVLAMGKHGAFELNYSSDIDLSSSTIPTTCACAPGWRRSRSSCA